MSKLIGDTIPSGLRQELDGEHLETKIGAAYLLVTADDDGTPRPCMLSAGEVLAVDDRRLRFALWKGSRTCENLTRGERALFCHVAPRTVLYLRGAARSLTSDPELNLDCFELEVDSVESDDHVGMPVVTGISFAVERGDPAAVVDAWRRQIAGLRAAERS
jgi:hypothetical protein